MNTRYTIQTSGLAILVFFLFFTFPQVRSSVKGSFFDKKEEKKENSSSPEKDNKDNKNTCRYLQSPIEAVLPGFNIKTFPVLVPDPAWFQCFVIACFEQPDYFPVTHFTGQATILSLIPVQPNAP